MRPPRDYRSERRNRKTDDSFYSSKRWRTLRAWFLRRNPNCVECERQGVIVPAEDVDHIIPITQGGDRLKSGNLQSLCKMHHTQKTNRERKEARRC